MNEIIDIDYFIKNILVKLLNINFDFVLLDNFSINFTFKTKLKTLFQTLKKRKEK